MKRIALYLFFVLWPMTLSSMTAMAGLTEQQLAGVTLDPPPNAHVPVDLRFKTIENRQITLKDAINHKPTLLLPADFTCTQICGPALSIAASALSQTGLRAGIDYSLVIVGIDASDTITDARRYVSGQIDESSASVLSGTDQTIETLMTAIGYRFQRDDAHQSIAHPAALVVLTADGHVVRALSSLALQPTDLRLALIEASHGQIGGLGGRIALLCYGFDAAHGIYTRQIATLLQIAGAATVFAVVLALAILFRRFRKPELRTWT